MSYDNLPRTGFVFKPTQKGQWLAGSNKASARFGAQSLMPNGHGWGKYLPTFEPQSHDGVEPCDCTVINSLKAWITLSNYYGYSLPKNASERFSAIMAGVRPPGANPHDVCDAIRRWGMVPETALPFNSDIKDVVNFYHPDPMDEGLVAEAKKIVQKYELGHEYVFNDSPYRAPTPNKQQLLKDALARGTVCVSVYAWRYNGQYYYKDQLDQDEHWTFLTDYVEGEYWIVDDSYTPYVKKLDWNFAFQSAELYFLQENRTGVAPNDRDYFSNLLRAISEFLKRLQLTYAK